MAAIKITRLQFLKRANNRLLDPVFILDLLLHAYMHLFPRSLCLHDNFDSKYLQTLCLSRESLPSKFESDCSVTRRARRYRHFYGNA